MIWQKVNTDNRSIINTNTNFSNYNEARTIVVYDIVIFGFYVADCIWLQIILYQTVYIKLNIRKL